MEQYRFRFRHFCAEKVALPPHPIHIWDARESNLPSGKWFFFSIYALIELYRFRRLFRTNTRRQTSPPATATVSDHFSTSNRISHISKKWLTAPHLELRRAGDTVRVTRSLSAASKQIFARKYALEKLSPRTTLCSPLHRSLFSKFSLEIAERSTQVLKVWGVRAPIVRRALPTP